MRLSPSEEELNEEQLTEIFRQLGASSPEQWAHSQVTEGIPQLLRFLFLKHAWAKVVAEGNEEWIEREIEMSKARPNLPYAGLGFALARCKAAGITSKDLTEIARCLQVRMIFAVTYLIDGPPYAELRRLKDLSWGLFQTSSDGRPIGPAVSGLHESVLQFDPTGREMRPRESA